MRLRLQLGRDALIHEWQEDLNLNARKSSSVFRGKERKKKRGGVD
jgi:hypothetical protein